MDSVPGGGASSAGGDGSGIDQAQAALDQSVSWLAGDVSTLVGDLAADSVAVAHGLWAAAVAAVDLSAEVWASRPEEEWVNLAARSLIAFALMLVPTLYFLAVPCVATVCESPLCGHGRPCVDVL